MGYKRKDEIKIKPMRKESYRKINPK